MKLHSKKDFGRSGENIAEKYLLNNNYEIIKKNFFCRQGEIDIIAKNNEYIIFIEVKSRSGVLYGNPAEAVGGVKKKHLFNVAKYYLFKNGLEDSYIRFDVIEVLLSKGRFEVNHIKQIM